LRLKALRLSTFAAVEMQKPAHRRAFFKLGFQEFRASLDIVARRGLAGLRLLAPSPNCGGSRAKNQRVPLAPQHIIITAT
jgi:hypothetical protein